VRSFICLAVVTLVFGACDNKPSSSTTTPATDALPPAHADVAGLWRLTQARVGNASLAIPDGYQFTSLRLYGDETARWGQAISGCEVGSVRLSVDASGTLDVDSNGYMRSCPPPGYDVLAGQYLPILASATGLQVSGDHLTITARQSRLVFARNNHVTHHAGR
jgi:hypothetical protein